MAEQADFLIVSCEGGAETGGLVNAENVVRYPHAGSATSETRRAMGNLAFDNLTAHFSGKPVLTRVV